VVLNLYQKVSQLSFIHSFIHLGSDNWAIEVLCKAKGDPCCKFIVSPPHQLREHLRRCMTSSLFGSIRRLSLLSNMLRCGSKGFRLSTREKRAKGKRRKAVVTACSVQDWGTKRICVKSFCLPGGGVVVVVVIICGSRFLTCLFGKVSFLAKESAWAYTTSGRKDLFKMCVTPTLLLADGEEDSIQPNPLLTPNSFIAVRRRGHLETEPGGFAPPSKAPHPQNRQLPAKEGQQAAQRLQGSPAQQGK